MGEYSTVTIQRYLSSTPTRTESFESKPSRVETITKNNRTTPGFNNPNRVGVLRPLEYDYLKTVDEHNTGFKRYVPISNAALNFTSSDGVIGPPGGYGEPTSATAVEDAQVTNDVSARADGKLRLKIKSSSVNLAVTTAEGNKTMRMVANAATRVYTGIRNLKQGRFVDAARAVGAVPTQRGRKRFERNFARDAESAAAKAWLELTYGWKPLLSDVYGSAKALADSERLPMYVTETVTEFFPQNDRRSVTTKSSGLTTQTWWETNRETLVRTSATFFRANDATTMPTALGLTNPALVAWELVPFSFVVDWFYPVGNFLDSLDATTGLEFHSGFRTVFVKRRFKGGSTTSGTASGQTVSVYYTGGSEAILMRRRVLSGFPTVSRPRFKNPVSVSHAASALALLSTLFRK